MKYLYYRLIYRIKKVFTPKRKVLYVIYTQYNDSEYYHAQTNAEGIFTNKEMAIKSANYICDQFNSWVNKMTIPLDVYLKHIDDFKTENYCEIGSFRDNMKFYDYLGYTEKDWRESHYTFKWGSLQQSISVMVRPFVLGYFKKGVYDETDDDDIFFKNVQGVINS